MNTHLKQLWAAMKLPEKLQKSYKFVCRGLAIRVAKVMEVARRLMKGDIVPSTDEKKLMEYNDKLYQMAKNMGEMAKVEKRKKHKSLWEDEEEKQYEDPDEVGANATAQGTAPQIKSAGDIMSSTGYNGAMDSEN